MAKAGLSRDKHMPSNRDSRSAGVTRPLDGTRVLQKDHGQQSRRHAAVAARHWRCIASMLYLLGTVTAQRVRLPATATWGLADMKRRALRGAVSGKTR